MHKRWAILVLIAVLALSPALAFAQVATETPTDTPVPLTATPSQTPTYSFTHTSTPTETPSNSPTITKTNTPTWTPTATQVSEPSYTPTKTKSPTNTPTITKTSTPTRTPTRTITMSQTPTVTQTPTLTPTPPCGPVFDKRGKPALSLCNQACAATPCPFGTPVPAFNEPFGRRKVTSCQLVTGASTTVQTYCFAHTGYWQGTPIPVGTPLVCPDFEGFDDNFEQCMCRIVGGTGTVNCWVDRIPDAVAPAAP